MQLIVLGMHRSGTSVLARLLNLMGAYFGPEGASTGANSENPKGFWERRDVRNLNDAVLHSVGCDWNRIANFDVTTLPAATVAAFNQGASRLVLDMDAHRPWFLKEPRLCLLFDLWRRRLETPVCIHIYRNPVEVASSLHKRNGIPIEVGLVLWERHVRSALRASSGLPQVVVSHRQLIEDPATAVAQLFEKLGECGVQGLRSPSQRELKAFVDDQFYREREGREDLQAYVNASQVEVFRSLLETGTAPEETKDQQSMQKELLEKFEAGLPPIKRSVGGGATESMEALRSQLALSEQQTRFARELCSKYESDIKRHDEWRADTERERISSREEIARLEFAVADRDARLAVERSEVALLRETVGRVGAENAQRDARVRVAEGEIDVLRESIAAHVGDVESLRGNLAASVGEVDALRGNLAASVGEVDTLRVNLAASVGEVETLRGNLAESADEIESLRRHLAASSFEVEALRESVANAEGELSAAGQMFSASQARISEMESVLAAAQDEVFSLRTSLQLQAENSELAGRTLRAENTLQHGQIQMLAAQVASLQASLLESQRNAERDRDERSKAEAILADCRHEVVTLTRLTIEKEVAVVALHGDLHAARAAHHELESRLHATVRASLSQKVQEVATLDRLQRRVTDMEKSLSWRIAAPLRRLRAALRKRATASALHSQLELIGSSELLDEAWYLSKNPDVAASGAAAAEHYVQFGAAEGRNPGPDFDSYGYLHRNPDVLAAGMNPLVHFLAHGQAEGRASQ